MMFDASMRTCFHHPGLKMVAKADRVHADAVIIHQKFTYGAVAGLNIIVHSAVAIRSVIMALFIGTVCR
jgi:hypothetical protein